MKKGIVGGTILLALLVFSQRSLIFASSLPLTLESVEKDCSIEDILTAEAQTKYARIYGYRGTEIPALLVSNFDKIYEKVAEFFKIKITSANIHNKVTVWVVDYDTLQKMWTLTDPPIVAAFYDARFNCIFFTPEYMNEYYIAHEIVNYFMDEYQEKATTLLAQLILEEEKNKLAAGK